MAWAVCTFNGYIGPYADYKNRAPSDFSHSYPDFLNPGVDDLLTTLETLAAEDAEQTGHVQTSGQLPADTSLPDSDEADVTTAGGEGGGNGTD